MAAFAPLMKRPTASVAKPNKPARKRPRRRQRRLLFGDKARNEEPEGAREPKAPLPEKACRGAPADADFRGCDAEPRPDAAAPSAKEFADNDFLTRIRSEAPGENKTLLSRGRGSRGEAVRLVQEAILAWGCRERDRNLLPGFGADGDFGGETDAAVRKFQCEMGDTVDGIVGPNTMRNLDAIVGGDRGERGDRVLERLDRPGPPGELVETPPFVPPGLIAAPPSKISKRGKADPGSPVGQPSRALPTKVAYWINAFIPKTKEGAFPAPGGPFAGRHVFPGPFHPLHINSCFETDERGFRSDPKASSRVRLRTTIDPSTALAKGTLNSDPTFEVDCTTGALRCLKKPEPTGGLVSQVALSSNLIMHQLDFSAGDPCVTGAPEVRVRANIFIDLRRRQLTAQLNTTLFPAFEMYVAGSSGAPRTVFRQPPVVDDVFALFVPSVSPAGGKASF